MTEQDVLHEVKEAIRTELSTHVCYIRSDIADIKAQISALKKDGCSVGARNSSRLDMLDKRAGTVGGIVGAIVGGVVSWIFGRVA